MHLLRQISFPVICLKQWDSRNLVPLEQHRHGGFQPPRNPRKRVEQIGLLLVYAHHMHQSRSLNQSKQATTKLRKAGK
jgi:hypothetical protein